MVGTAAAAAAAAATGAAAAVSTACAASVWEGNHVCVQEGAGRDRTGPSGTEIGATPTSVDFGAGARCSNRFPRPALSCCPPPRRPGSPHRRIPGLAMSRALGDHVAHQ